MSRFGDAMFLMGVLFSVPACDGLGQGADALLDAGPDAASLDDCGDGGLCAPENSDPCDVLVEACCGETCGESPACAAAGLLQRHEPEGCEAALADTQTYPRCALGNCDTLVEKACGPANECPDAPGCAPAQALHARNADPDASQDEIEEAALACLQALEDETVFAPCF